MKLKSKILVALILGVCSLTTLSVGAIGDESESGSESGSCSSPTFSDSFGDPATSDSDLSSCCDSFEGLTIERSDDASSTAQEAGRFVHCSPSSDSFGSPASSDSGSSSAPSVSSSSVIGDGVASTSLQPYHSTLDREIFGEVLTEVSAPTDDEATICSGFNELVENLRARQQKGGFEHSVSKFRPEGEDGWTQDYSRYTYWINTKLPTTGVNLYNKWFGENLQHNGGELPNGVAALLPTSYFLRAIGKSYTVDELRNIILNPSNWEAHKGGNQIFKGGICQPDTVYGPNDLDGAQVLTFDDYIDYLRKRGVDVR